MRLRLLILAALALASIFLPHARGQQTSSARGGIPLAITVDDLPGAGPEEKGYTHIQMLKDIVATLQSHGVPRAAGFIVGEMLEGHPERGAGIEAWLNAGFLVGNHTYSHDKISQLGLARYMDGIVKNRALVDALEHRSGQLHSYFRFPYLEEGETPRERKALAQLLHGQRYINARPSVTFGDTDWADAYLRCQAQGDQASLAALDRSYLDNAVARLHWSVAAAHEVLGRAIPHVLLLHVNVPTAKNLDALLRAYEAQGVRFVGFDEAMREPAYAGVYDEPGGNLLEQASRHLGRPTPPDFPPPAVLIDRVCP